jgi:hypothetical protein
VTLPDEEEPGLDLYDWESRFQQLEPDLADDPAQALPELADLVREMLEERGADVDDPVLGVSEEREFVVDYRAAREVADRVERGEDVDPGDIGAAIQSLRAAYEYVVAERRAP